MTTVPLLVLPGALGRLESAGKAYERIRAARTLIEYDYPNDGDLDALLRRISSLIDNLGVPAVDILGTSLGGYLAQCFARLCPAQVRHLVLAHTYVLSAADARKLRWAQSLGRAMPLWLFRNSVRLKVRYALKPVKKHRPREYARVVQSIEQVITQAVSPDMVRRNNGWMIEAQTRFPFSSSDTRQAGHVLIIESENDPLINARARSDLRRAYPAARVHTFPDAGHVSALAVPAAFADVVNAFLEGSST
jgi:pimeloyl-ACP methyl ester carboxylesterase